MTNPRTPRPKSKPAVDLGDKEPVYCPGCHYEGTLEELDPGDDDDTQIFCPRCGSPGWVWGTKKENQ
jgi:uncharacterized paraquat-inducible protein A